MGEAEASSAVLCAEGAFNSLSEGGRGGEGEGKGGEREKKGMEGVGEGAGGRGCEEEKESHRGRRGRARVMEKWEVETG